MTTAQLLWHVQNCDMIGSSKSKLKKFSQDYSYELKNEMIPILRTMFIQAFCDARNGSFSMIMKKVGNSVELPH